jgi:hypothetical protein
LAVEYREGLSGAPGRSTATTRLAVVAPRCPPGRRRHRTSACRASALPAIAYSAGGWKAAGRPPAAMAHAPPRVIMDDAAVAAGRRKLPPVKRPNGSKTIFKPPAEYVLGRARCWVQGGHLSDGCAVRRKPRRLARRGAKFSVNRTIGARMTLPAEIFRDCRDPAAEEGRDT